MKKIWLAIALGTVTTGFSQTNTTPVQLVNPQAVAAPKGYSQAAVVDLGNCNMILLSGQVPLDSQGNLTGKGDREKQTVQVFKNIRGIVEELGGNMHHVIKIKARDLFVDAKHPPASTLVQVNKLFRDDVLVEVEATAIIPQ